MQEWIAVPVTLAVLAGVLVLLYYGEKEPVVIFHESQLQIKCMFGQRIDAAGIAGIWLLEESMAEIGAGWRTFGYGGRALKGQFTSGLLFVRPDAAPTVMIERHGAPPVYISFRDSERSEQLYEELQARYISYNKGGPR